jgi:hypothetical protein
MEDTIANTQTPSFQYLQNLLSAGPIEGGGAHPLSYHVLQLLLEHQNTSGFFGDLVEIGVWRGDTFALLASASLESQNSIAIDIGEHWLKTSALLAKDKCRDFGVAPRIHTIQGSSTNRNMADILCKTVGDKGIRFAHIDGEHSRELALSDARLLESAMAPYGLICFDDCFSLASPGVAQAFFQFSSETEWKPLLFTPNKAYLCHQRYTRQYRKFVIGIVETLDASRSITASISSSSYYPDEGFVSIFSTARRFYQVVNRQLATYDEFVGHVPAKLDNNSCQSLDF